MTSLPAPSVSARPENPPSPDLLADPGIQFAVEWQVVERIQQSPEPQPVEAWGLS